MRYVTAVFILGFFVLSCLTSIRGEFLGGQPSFSQAAAVELETVPADGEHTLGSFMWHSPMTSVTKRGNGTTVLLCVSVRFSFAPDAHALARSCPPFPAALYHAAPLYQSLQVFRF